MAADRISQLPDSVLHHILSFLPAKLVVKTSILSQRWRYLWASISHIRITSLDFPSTKSFEHFTVAMLLCRDASSPIQTFDLYWDRDFDQAHADTWIYHAVRRNVRELNLTLLRNAKLPRCIFTCKSLTVLKLTTPNCLRDMEFPINLSGLETLHLSAISFEEETLVKLITGCPVLECLKIMSCRFHVLDINSRKLKHLDLLETGSKHAKVRVSAPGLKSLDIQGLVAEEISLEHLASLERAYLRDLFFYGPTKIFRGLYAARNLQLYDSALEYIFMEMLSSQYALPLLQRLKNLKLMTSMCDGFLEAIARILHRSPNLQNLVIEFCEGVGLEKKSWTERKPVPGVLSDRIFANLKSVEIHHFRSRLPSAHEFVKFLLFHGKKLEKILITPLGQS